MENYKLKILTLGICVLGVSAMTTNSFASMTNVRGVIENNSSITGAGSQTVTVTASKGSSFSITIPKRIELDNTTNTESESIYTVQIKGDIASDEVITVSPDSSFNMTQSGGRTFPVVVTQLDTTAEWDEISGVNGKTINGRLDGASMTAGNWQGTFNFNISLNKK